MNQSFGDVRTLNGVNFHLANGHVHTLKRGSYSSKTACIGSISDYQRLAEGGSELKQGKPIRFLPFRLNRPGIGRTFQDARLEPQSSVNENILKVEHLTTGYGKKQVLTDVSFSVEKGEIILLGGGNGSGKSTVLKTIYGLLHPWTPEGKIFFDGKEITALPASTMIRRGIVYIPQKKSVLSD
jgi:ABC-type branched-subunit amino acid transport system ATPase component